MQVPGDTQTLFRLLPTEQLPVDPEWLVQQACPIIGVGPDPHSLADVVVADEEAAGPLIAAIEKHPRAALVLVQVLRGVQHLSPQAGITFESMAYGLLQAGSEYHAWLAQRDKAPQLITGTDDNPVRIERAEQVLRATLNRPEQRNSLTVEMRDALIELFELVALDESIERLEIRGEGACFSVGGELREFGLAPGPDTAHLIRSFHNPSRLLAGIADRVVCYVHGACVGSGIELPAFSGRLVARRKTYFQLPELQFGLIPGAGGCVSVSRRIGRQRTAWLALTGKRINSATALDWGLIDEIVD